MHHNYDYDVHHNYDDDVHHNYDDDGQHTVYQVRCPCLCQLPNRNSRTGDLLENIKKLQKLSKTQQDIAHKI